MADMGALRFLFWRDDSSAILSVPVMLNSRVRGTSQTHGPTRAESGRAEVAEDGQ
jgi:hypothetical protein